MYESVPVDGDVVVSQPSHQIFSDVNLPENGRLPGLLGYEADRSFRPASSDLVVLAHSPYDLNGRTNYGDMSLYTSTSGSMVFATGSMQWAWGLDDYNAPAIRTSRLSDAAQQITKNVLALLVQSGRSRTFPVRQEIPLDVPANRP